MDGIDSFAIWEKYIQHFKQFIENVAELLPVLVDNNKFYIVNVTSLVECLNEKESLYGGSTELYTKNISDAYSVEKFVFDPKKFGKDSLFRLKAGSIYPNEVFCYEGVKPNPEDEFKYFVEKNKFTGLRFKCVWDSEKE